MKLFLSGCALLALLVGCQKSPKAGAMAPQALSQGGSISGQITLAPEMMSKVGPTDTLYIIAKKGAGPPLAVKRLANITFPFHYEMTAADVMFPGTPFQGEVQVVARVDKDGNAGPAQPGDLEGTSTKSPARVGDGDVNIVINKAY